MFEMQFDHVVLGASPQPGVLYVKTRREPRPDGLQKRQARRSALVWTRDLQCSSQAKWQPLLISAFATYRRSRGSTSRDWRKARRSRQALDALSQRGSPAAHMGRPKATRRSAGGKVPSRPAGLTAASRWRSGARAALRVPNGWLLAPYALPMLAGSKLLGTSSLRLRTSIPVC
jgi:hypothetical protein